MFFSSIKQTSIKNKASTWFNWGMTIAFDMPSSVVLLLLVFFSHISYGNGFSKFWGSVTYSGQYDRLLYTLEPQIRLIDRPEKYDQFLLNSGIGTKITSPFQIWLGQTYINYADTNDIAEDVAPAVKNEYRIWEQIMWHRPFYEELASRSRLEQRHSFQSAQWAVRFRERAYWTIPLNTVISLALSDEIFINLKPVPWVSTPTFDQNRLFIGFFYQFTTNIGLNVSYINQYINKRDKEYNNGVLLNLVIYAF